MKSSAIAAFLLATVVLLTGCGKKLTREDAADLIRKNPELENLRTAVPIHEPLKFPARARAEGIQVSQQRLLFFDPVPDVIQRGESLLSDVQPKVVFDEATKTFRFRLKSPVAIRVTVTGLTEDPGSKGIRQAEFQWAHESLPPVVKRFAASGGSGTARLRLFDDGWRVEAISVSVLNTALPLSAEEATAQQADVKRESERMAETQRRAAEAGVAMQARLDKASANTRMIQEYRSDIKDFGQTTRHIAQIGDTSLWVTQRAGMGTNYVWYGLIKSVGYDPHWKMMLIQLNCFASDVGGKEFHFQVSVDQRPSLEKTINEAIAAWRTKHGEFANSTDCGRQYVGIKY